MELKDKRQLLFDIFNGGENENFSELIMRVINSGNNEFYEKYLSCFPDLQIDELKSVWQFWSADREEKKQDYTSQSLAKLVGKLALMNGGNVVYDCCSGSGALTIGAWNVKKDIYAVCEELDAGVIPLLLFNLIIRNIPGHVSRMDILSGECYESWEIAKGAQFGVLQKELFPHRYSGKIDVAVSNPPFNLAANTNGLFAEKCLSVSNRAVLILPNGFLSGDRDKISRCKLIQERNIAAVVKCPDKMFESTSIPVCLIILQRNQNNVWFVDATECNTEIRLQRGEGSKSHTERLYRKEINVLSDAQIDAICACSMSKTDKSFSVDYSEIEANGNELKFGLYIKTPIDAEYSTHRDFDDIVSDINKITRLKNTIKVTINKVWAEQLGLDLEEHAKTDKELVGEINHYLDELGITEKLIQPDYFSKSASRILEIKQNDKEILSPVIESFIPLWVQHIKTMNKLENLLFAEFRDALLPALMSGRILKEK